jgi:hypothetical protein
MKGFKTGTESSDRLKNNDLTLEFNYPPENSDDSLMYLDTITLQPL